MIERRYEVRDGALVDAPLALWEASLRARVRVVVRDLPEDQVDLTVAFDPHKVEGRVVVEEAADLTGRTPTRRRWGRRFWTSAETLRLAAVDVLRLSAEEAVAEFARAGGRLS